MKKELKKNWREPKVEKLDVKQTEVTVKDVLKYSTTSVIPYK